MFRFLFGVSFRKPRKTPEMIKEESLAKVAEINAKAVAYEKKLAAKRESFKAKQEARASAKNAKHQRRVRRVEIRRQKFQAFATSAKLNFSRLAKWSTNKWNYAKEWRKKKTQTLIAAAKLRLSRFTGWIRKKRLERQAKKIAAVKKSPDSDANKKTSSRFGPLIPGTLTVGLLAFTIAALALDLPWVWTISLWLTLLSGRATGFARQKRLKTRNIYCMVLPRLTTTYVGTWLMFLVAHLSR